MNRTPIEWIRNPDGTPGYTFNPITGCLNNCSYCYARKLANGRLKSRYLANKNISTQEVAIIGGDRYHEKQSDPFYPRFWPGRIRELEILLHKPSFQQKPKGIFVCDMGELFGDWLPIEWQKEVFRIIRINPQHRFYLLTKQPQNLIKFSPFPDNCWVGVTATNAEYFAKACMSLKDVDAKVKYLSIEPYLGMIIGSQMDIMLMTMAGIGWLIIGAQTRPLKLPQKAWIDEITGSCKKAGIPYFLKNNLKPLLGDNLIQDMPKGVDFAH